MDCKRYCRTIRFLIYKTRFSLTFVYIYDIIKLIVGFYPYKKSHTKEQYQVHVSTKKTAKDFSLLSNILRKEVSL